MKLKDALLTTHRLIIGEIADEPPVTRVEHTKDATLSVIIPTLNEETNLRVLLEKLRGSTPHEIIVSDGGSRDKTVAVAEQAGVEVIDSPSGRAVQMNRAASVATGDYLLFLHADTLPPINYQTVVQRVLDKPGVSAGSFRFKLSSGLLIASLIEKFVDLRCRLLEIPYGDQGLFVRRSTFNHLGGFPDWPVMEDLDFVRQLKRLGRVITAPEAAITSPRRWINGGTTRTFFRHQIMLAAYYLGLPARHIARFRF